MRKIWKRNEKKDTLFTDTRFLHAILKEAGVVSSAGEVRKNKLEFAISPNKLDCLWIKWVRSLFT